ncbi:sulfate transporter, putative [Eimeria necatrix]|uniref:Sulfate transporter, putative n=1 Tax=Eimeria necatrix TaxID=51315 RepID=U6N2M0_9EIME|nr:sulfate transporter, putative [Eimeria necatrix]CDJ68180.1 sulfate transporter, putative [Eimeria necatrix]
MTPEHSDFGSSLGGPSEALKRNPGGAPEDPPASPRLTAAAQAASSQASHAASSQRPAQCHIGLPKPCPTSALPQRARRRPTWAPLQRIARAASPLGRPPQGLHCVQISPLPKRKGQGLLPSLCPAADAARCSSAHEAPVGSSPSNCSAVHAGKENSQDTANSLSVRSPSLSDEAGEGKDSRNRRSSSAAAVEGARESNAPLPAQTEKPPLAPSGSASAWGSFLRPQWMYCSSAELTEHCMQLQSAPAPGVPGAPGAPPGGAGGKACAPLRGLGAYCESLYRWGWCCLPPRYSREWLSSVAPVCVSGLFLPFAMVPTAMTCAVISGLPVAAALNSCWLLCLLTALIGGAPGTVCTITEALATVLVSTVTEDCSGGPCIQRGREFLFPAGILCGVVQSACGLLGLGKLVALVPAASRVGYVAAVAVINLRSQLHAFKYDPVSSTGYEWLAVLLMVLQVCLVMHLWPLCVPTSLSRHMPASAVALGLSVFSEFICVRRLCRMRTRTVGDVSALAGGGNMPSWFFLSPSFVQPSQQLLSFKGLYTLLEVALTLVLLTSMSTLMTLERLQEDSRWRYKVDAQLVAVGLSNSVSCLFGGLPGTTGMMTSLLASRMGAAGREGPLLSALFLCVFTSVAHHVLDAIPLGALSGAIIYTALSAVSWRSFVPVVAACLPRRLTRRISCMRLRSSKTDAAVMLVTCVLGPSYDLGAALLIGIFISLASFAWQAHQSFNLDCHLDEETETKFYFIQGPLFFPTLKRLQSLIDASVAPKRSVVLLHTAAAAAPSPSAPVLLALGKVLDKHQKEGKQIALYGVDFKGAAIALHAGRALEAHKIAVRRAMGLAQA